MSGWSQQTPEQLVARASQFMPFWLSLITVILIGYYAAKIFWLLFPAGESQTWIPPANIAIESAQNAEAAAGSETIVDAHLFGMASIDEVPTVAEDTTEAPETRLRLVLRATVTAEDPKIAHAIITSDNDQEKVYFTGDIVTKGTTLHKVQIDRVILNRGGVLEALRLPRQFAGNAAPTRRKTSNSGPTTRTIQQMVTENAANLGEIIRPQPFMPNGQLKGYRVFPGRNRAQFVALGLRPGDLVTEINGVLLNNPSQGMAIFRSLGETTQVSVTVERNGKQETLNLDTNNIQVPADSGNAAR